MSRKKQMQRRYVAAGKIATRSNSVPPMNMQTAGHNVARRVGDLTCLCTSGDGCINLGAHGDAPSVIGRNRNYGSLRRLIKPVTIVRDAFRLRPARSKTWDSSSTVLKRYIWGTTNWRSQHLTTGQWSLLFDLFIMNDPVNQVAFIL